MNKLNNQIVIAGAVVAATIVAYIAGLLVVIAAAQPLSSPLASWPLWPVACSTRGCVSSAAWLQQHELTSAYNQATEQEAPTPEQSLTTAIRAHIVANAFLRSPVTANNVQRYREEILHATNDEQVQKYVPLTVGEYDERILTPFLQQEALRAEHKVESTDELYKILTANRPIFLLLFHYRWDADTGNAVAK